MGIDGNNVVYSFTTVVIGYGGGTRLGKREECTGSRGIDACAPLSRTLYCNGRYSHTGGIAKMGNGFRVQFQIEVSAFQLYHVYGRFQIAEREFYDSAAPVFYIVQCSGRYGQCFAVQSGGQTVVQHLFADG